VVRHRPPAGRERAGIATDIARQHWAPAKAMTLSSQRHERQSRRFRRRSWLLPAQGSGIGP
jgi:hypothetical protein